MSVQDKIEAAKVAAAAALEAQIKLITEDDKLRSLAPDYDAVKRTSNSRYDNVSDILYEINSAEELVAIIEAYRAKYGSFLPIGKYVDGCAVVTAYPWKEYADIAPVSIEGDAVEARNSKGKGFSSISFKFYPNVPGERISVSVDLAFRAYISGFEGNINANYNRNGDPTNVEKRPPSEYKKAAYTVSFGGGSRDTADWRGVFSADALLGALVKEEVVA